MKINLDGVSEIMEERGITSQDIEAVIEWGEGEGGKLTDDGKNLAKKRIDKFMVYVEYMDDGTVTNTYGHRVTLVNSEAE